MQPLPNQNSPFVRINTGLIVPPWNTYLQQFTQAPPPFVDITPSVSPLGYTAKEPGYVMISGGTVGAITLTRGTTSIILTGQKIIPVSINDTVSIAYSVLPTVLFNPIYGANTAR